MVSSSLPNNPSGSKSHSIGFNAKFHAFFIGKRLNRCNVSFPSQKCKRVRDMFLVIVGLLRLNRPGIAGGPNS